MRHARRLRLVGLLAMMAASLLLVGCDGTGSAEQGGFALDNCTIATDQLVQGCEGRDCIPSIDGVTPRDPRLVDASGADRLPDDDRVIGLLVGGQPLAIPHRILWSREVVNIDEWGGRTLAVTYCPLTGSSLAFDRNAVGGAEMGVSGLLFNNNLVMYDRAEQSLWPQMNRQASCGPAVGMDLAMVPVVEMRWARWRALHPDTKVLSTGRSFSQQYPYGSYENPNAPPLYDMPVDDRRPPKERVLGLPNGDEQGLALPFGALDDGSEARVVSVTTGGTDTAVFWSDAARSAMAYRPFLDGQRLSFKVQNGRIVDTETGSVWTVDGRAVEGPLADTRLPPVETAYVSFWFAWASFQPDADLWTGATDA